MRTVTALVAALLVLAACGEDAPAEPSAADRLRGAWNLAGIEEGGAFEQVDESGHVVVVFADDGALAYVGGDGAPDLDEVCALDSDHLWALSDDESTIEVTPRRGPSDEGLLVWSIVELGEAVLTFEEGSDLFHFSRLGDC